jgi:hypothetical protein
MIEAWNETERIDAAFSLGLDFLYLCLYSTTIAFACLWAAGVFRARRGKLAAAGAWLAWWQWLAALLDAAENTALLCVAP